MRGLSDYKDEAALELWADIMEPLAGIFSDKRIAQMYSDKTTPIKLASFILKEHKAEAKEILLRIDDTPLNGLNIITRLVALVSEFMRTDVTADFFESQGQNKVVEFSGSATENIEGGER